MAEDRESGRWSSLGRVVRTARLALVALVLSACNWLDYDAVNIHERVVSGGQASIDAGNVVDYDGLPGIWLAGHRSSHGSVFANLTQARVGDRACLINHCYTVVRIINHPNHDAPGYLGPLVLQTSLPHGRLLLVVCE